MNPYTIIRSQLPFGFDVVWYKGVTTLAMNLNKKSQLPFGFDVVWYKASCTATSIRGKRHNCLSALMSFGTMQKAKKVLEQATGHNCLSALRSFGTSQEDEYGKSHRMAVTIAFRL